MDMSPKTKRKMGENGQDYLKDKNFDYFIDENEEDHHEDPFYYNRSKILNSKLEF
jgi:hypothetical protein